MIELLGWVQLIALCCAVVYFRCTAQRCSGVRCSALQRLHQIIQISSRSLNRFFWNSGKAASFITPAALPDQRDTKKKSGADRFADRFRYSQEKNRTRLLRKKK